MANLADDKNINIGRWGSTGTLAVGGVPNSSKLYNINNADDVSSILKSRGVSDINSLQDLSTGGQSSEVKSLADLQGLYDQRSTEATAQQAAPLSEGTPTFGAPQDMSQQGSEKLTALNNSISPINTSQPSPTSVNATPFTGTTPDQIKQGLANAQASGAAVPTTQGQANIAIAQNTPKPVDNTQAIRSANIDTQLAQDPGYQQLLQDYSEYNSVANQNKSLLDTYNQIVKSSGLEGINTELLNTKRIIDGTEDDIRNEVTAANGFATESQVLALASARNKSLIKNYNALVDQQTSIQNHVDTMVNLASQDRQFAIQNIQNKLQIDQQISQYRDKFVQNAKEGYQNVINAVGYGGFLQMMGNDPNSISLAEQTLGMAPGGLQQIASFQQNQSNLKNLSNYTVTSPYVITAGGEVQNTQSGQAYKVPADFQAQTGMTLDQAGAKGLVKPLGLTKDETQQQFENNIKSQDLAINRAQLGISAKNAETARINATAPKISIEDVGGKKMVIATDNQGNIVNQQPLTSATPTAGPQELASTQANIDLTSGLLKNKNLKTSVGPNGLSRINVGDLRSVFTPGASDFIAGVQQLTSQLTLDSLVRAKAQGATFGALSEGELNILSGSASKLNSWAVKDKQGNVVGYNTTEKSFTDELNRINNFAKLDYVLKGGDASSVGVQVHPDGSAWTANPDGSVTQITPGQSGPMGPGLK